MKELAKKIISDRNFDMEAYNYIKKQLDEETAKPLRKRDFNKIGILTGQLAEIKGTENADNSEDISELFGRIEEYEKKNTKSVRAIKKVIPAVCCAAALLAVNCISVFAWDMNIVSAVIEFTKGGFSVSFNKDKQDSISLPISENDPYGIIAECAKYEIYPETPFYLPDGFKLQSISKNVNKDYANVISFTFKNADMSISLDYKRYWNEMTNTVIPSEDFNISEIEINGNAAIVSKEDNQFTVHYIKDDTAYVIFTQDVPYDECDKIVSSIK